MSRMRIIDCSLETIILKLTACFSAGCLLFTFACSHSSQSEPLLPGVEGYNFTVNENESWAGPKTGERIDLTRLKGRNGISLAQEIEGRVAILAVVDPRCGMCEYAYDQMRFVNNNAKRTGVRYYLVSITASTATPDLRASTPSEFFQYTDSIKVNAPAFLWNVADGQAPDALYSMSVPSHVLIDQNGMVIRKWLGTDQQESVRKRMAKQIILDLRSELAKFQNRTSVVSYVPRTQQVVGTERRERACHQSSLRRCLRDCAPPVQLQRSASYFSSIALI